MNREQYDESWEDSQKVFPNNILRSLSCGLLRSDRSIIERKLIFMPKIKQCDSCRFYSNNPNLFCAVNPGGVETDTCLDYRLSPDYIFLQQWNPDNYVYYDQELIKLPEDKPDKERQLWLLNHHPAFTGSCGNCGYEYPRKPLSWDCPECGTEYD